MVQFWLLLLYDAVLVAAVVWCSFGCIVQFWLLLLYGAVLAAAAV